MKRLTPFAAARWTARILSLCVLGFGGFFLVAHRRHRRRNAVPGWLVAAIVAPALLATPAGATQWKIPCAIGYGAATGLALAGLVGMTQAGQGLDGADEVFDAAGVGLGVGAVAGFVIGSTADKRIGEGTPLSRGHRNAVRVGTVLCGGLAGAVAGGRWIDRARDSTRDEEIVIGSIAAGMALGGLAQWLMDGALGPAPVVRPASNGRPAAAGLAFRW